MAEYFEFDGALEPLVWGRNTYTILRLPRDLEAAARAENTRRLEGFLDEAEVNMGLNKADADVLRDAFVYVGASMQRRIGAEPGDVVRCRLRPVDPTVVVIDDDVRSALDDGDVLGAFESRTPAWRRRALAQINFAKSAATRTRRIATLVAELRALR